MKPFTFMLIALLGVFSGCGNDLDIEKGTPNCIKKKIKSFDKNGSCAIANVKEYRFQEKTVFVFDPGDCTSDKLSPVFDSDCNELGYLGGIAGSSEVNGENFSSAQYVKTTWQK